MSLNTILQVNTTDTEGGAERIAVLLHQYYRSIGWDAWLGVGYQRSNLEGVIPIGAAPLESTWARCWQWLGHCLDSQVGRIRGVGRLRHLCLDVFAHPVQWNTYRIYRDHFHYPASHHLLGCTPTLPSIVHAHNLHGNYFDLRALPKLCRKVPVVLTLHDAWLQSGHCAHSLACERWLIGCGECPELSIYPAIDIDATHANWRHKAAIFAKSRLYVATPCQWLMDKANRSLLAPAIVEARVIPHGVDVSVFSPGDIREARKQLGLPHDARILLFAANGIRANHWKDYQTLRAALALVAGRHDAGPLLLLALGEDAPSEYLGGSEIRFIPFKQDQQTVARYYQAADLYVHAARVDTFPNTVMEALACGAPVIATAVGGIPEQISEGETGYLTPAGDPHALAEAILFLLAHPQQRQAMAVQAREAALTRWNSIRCAEEYLAWYGHIIQSFPGNRYHARGRRHSS